MECVALHSDFFPGTEHILSPNLIPKSRTQSPAPELSASNPPQTLFNKTETKTSADVLQIGKYATAQHDEKEQSAKEDQQEQEFVTEEQSVDEVGAEDTKATDGPEVRGQDVHVEVELEEKGQPAEVEVGDSVVLSEKERQNEEVNEKDNCSASSISSTSSTLEREEREQKLTKDFDSGSEAGFTLSKLNPQTLMCFINVNKV